MTYEGYAHGGVAVLLEVATDNKNRTVAEVRHIFSKYGGAMGENGSVAWMFDKKGIITIPKQNESEDDIMAVILDAGAEDLSAEDEFYEITSPVESFESVRKALIENQIEIENASLQWIAKNTVSVEGDDAEKVMKCIEALEDSDDVQSVYSNADFVE